jgi:hypothetical protein
VHKRFLALVIVTAGMLSAEQPESRTKRLWKWSLAAVAAGNAADVATSMGRHELNPVLGAGTFGMRATGIKIGISTATVGVQYLLVRRHPQAARKLAIVNFGMAAATGGVAAHNVSLR